MDSSVLKQASLSVFDKLASLKQWQSEQHEKLVKEQEKHRELLVEEHKQLFQNLIGKIDTV